MTENTTASGAADIATTICRSVAELPDRNSPADWPEAMLVTSDELHQIVTDALAASAPVAPTQPDWRELCRRLYVELFHCDKQMTCSLNEDGEPIWRTGTEVRDVLSDAKAALEANPITPEAAPVAPAPQPAPPTEKTLEKLRKWEQNGELIERAWKVLNDQENEIIRLERELAAAPKADHIEDGLAMVPAPLQQGEYPETLYEGGRESVDDALAVVESFGPGVQGLNDTFARQVLLGQEVRRLRAAYEHACQGRSDFRNLYRAARGAVQPDPWHQAVLDACFQVESCYVEADPVKTVNSLIDWHVQNERRAAQAAPAPVAEDAEDAARWRTLRALTLDASAMCVVVNPRRDVKLGAYCPSHELLDALVDTIRAQAAQPEGGAKP